MSEPRIRVADEIHIGKWVIQILEMDHLVGLRIFRVIKRKGRPPEIFPDIYLPPVADPAKVTIKIPKYLEKQMQGLKEFIESYKLED